jgi:tRNA threonylcarbamoyladenosine biosynthesis protein TsaB
MLLAIDTCGASGGVALGPVAGATDTSRETARPDGSGNVLFRELAGRTYSELLLSTVSELLTESGVGLDNLSAVVVVHGPGSFTGIRIGVSAAKGVAEALRIPVIAVSRLELLARRAVGTSALSILDAGRGEFFAGIYRAGFSGVEGLLGYAELAVAASEAGLPLLVCENRVFAVLDELGAEMIAAPTAVEALSVGAERFRAEAFDDVATLDANYLRRSETEMLARIAEHAALRAPSGTAGSSTQ